MSKPRPFATRLLAWWNRHGRKDLPWQHPRTPYRVWISEIMLQQTQVSTVIPYFERWMQRFPHIRDLALAPLDEVLAHWAGLGYYARARHLHSAAKICLERHAGALPPGAAELAALPGIGRSTANAIVSQSTDRPAAILDGNVRRVLARHARLAGWTGSTAVQNKLWTEAEKRLPKKRGADYSQAVMDLGALVCTRAKPDCGHCPVGEDCQARLANEVSRYPAPKPGTQVHERQVFMLILQDDAQRVLLEKRPPAGIWGGLWCLPDAENLQALEEKMGLVLGGSFHLPPREHRLTHLRMSIQPLLLNTLRPEQIKCSGEYCWMALDHRDAFGVPKPVADLLYEVLTSPSMET